MRLVLALPLLLSSACLPRGRTATSVPVIVRIDATAPIALSNGTLTLDRSVISLANLILYDADGAILGEWAGERRANLLGAPGPHGTVDLYDGTAVSASFAITGAPAFELEGSLDTTDGSTEPVTYTIDDHRYVDDVVASFAIDARTPPPALAWHLDLSEALASVPWSGDVQAAAIMDALSRTERWRITLDDGE